MKQSDNKSVKTVSRTRRRIYEAPTTEVSMTDEIQAEEIKETAPKAELVKVEVESTISEGDRLIKADKIVRRYMYISGGVGLIPSVILDIASLTSSLVAMISELGRLYEIPVDQLRNKPLIIAAVSSLLTQGLMHTKLLLALRAIPIFGILTDLLFYPAVASGLTYAVGKTFVAHFEEGKTLKDFSANDVKERFKKYMKAAPKPV